MDLKKIALPAEHGSWGLVLEPIVLGLLVAPSLPGFALALGAFAAFLFRRPLKVFVGDWGRARSSRTTAAMFFVLAYGAVAVAGLGATAWLAGTAALLPLAAALPFGSVFVAYDLANDSRSWQAEFAGSIVFAAVAAGIAIAGGWPAEPALALSAVPLARALPSILYVRMRIRLDRGRPYRFGLTVGAHAAALAAIVALIQAGLLPALAALPFVVLLARSATGLSAYRRRVRIQTLGFAEIGLGAFTVLGVAVGYWMTA